MSRKEQIGTIPVGSVINDGHGNEAEIMRFFAASKKDKVCFEIRRSGGGHAMGEVDDTTRFEVLRRAVTEPPPATGDPADGSVAGDAATQESDTYAYDRLF